MPAVLLNLSIGRSRTDIHWKNQQMSWTNLLQRLQTPTRTQESEKEWAKLSKSKQASIKDVGGFVGGFLKGGRRKAGAVQSRSLITLDVDFPKGDLWDAVELTFDHAAAMYGTHHYTAKNKRVRLVIPLARPVTDEEYEPVARKIAEQFGMDLFDDTTYQPERLMYWPSCPRDSEFFYRDQGGSWLDPDAVLARYPDWRDSSYWPESSRSDGLRQREAKRAGDPLEKGGIIGAFCRTYTIEDAIVTFLSDVYSPTDHPDRWTYVAGSTFGGLVLYDDKFAYSHHATDPVGDMLTNAWDLVRIHLFGDLDEDAKDKTPINKRESSKRMREFALKDDAVRSAVASEHINDATEDFAEPLPEDGTDDKSISELLVLDDNGNIEPSAENLETIMLHDPKLRQNFYTDLFSNRVYIRRDTPWRKVSKDPYWGDADDAGLRVYIEKTYGISNRNKVDDAWALEVQRNAVHPVRDYLKGLSWDGTPRVETLLVDYLGAEDTRYVRTVTRKFMAAAVARVMHPGVKFDYMLITSGPQGIGKSTLPAQLAGKWFSDTLDTVVGKDAYEALQGVWIMEMAEMKATKKADIEALKMFISKPEDAFRPAYARRKQYFPRQTVFWGTSNDPQFLRDKTGNRRFWPVDVGVIKDHSRVWEDLTPEVVDQVWAEAVQIYDAGEQLFLDKDEESLALEQQQLHSEESALEGMIVDYLSIPITTDWYAKSPAERRRYIGEYQDSDDDLGPDGGVGDQPRTKISVAEIWVEMLGGDIKNMAPVKAAEIRAILNNLNGWERHKGGRGRLKFGDGYGQQLAYEKNDGTAEK